MNNPKNIQEILDKKALAKLEKDIQQFLSDLINSPIWSSISGDLSLATSSDEKIENQTLRSFFHMTRSHSSEGWQKAPKMMLEKLLPQYIEAESKAFFDMVNGLQSQLDNFEQEFPDPE